MLWEEVFRVFHHLLNLVLVNSPISAGLEYLLDAGFLLLFVSNGSTFACTCLHMSVTITLLSKRFATMITWKGLRSTMDADMVKYIANFEKLAATYSTYEDLIWASSEAIVTKNFSKPSFAILFTNIYQLIIMSTIVLFKLLWGLIFWLEADIWSYNQVLNSNILMNHVLARVSKSIWWNLCFHVHCNRHLNSLDRLVLLQYRWCWVQNWTPIQILFHRYVDQRILTILSCHTLIVVNHFESLDIIILIRLAIECLWVSKCLLVDKRRVARKMWLIQHLWFGNLFDWALVLDMFNLLADVTLKSNVVCNLLPDGWIVDKRFLWTEIRL